MRGIFNWNPIPKKLTTKGHQIKWFKYYTINRVMSFCIFVKKLIDMTMLSCDAMVTLSNKKYFITKPFIILIVLNDFIKWFIERLLVFFPNIYISNIHSVFHLCHMETYTISYHPPYNHWQIYFLKIWHPLLRLVSQ